MYDIACTLYKQKTKHFVNAKHNRQTKKRLQKKCAKSQQNSKIRKFANNTHFKINSDWNEMIEFVEYKPKTTTTPRTTSIKTNLFHKTKSLIHLEVLLQDRTMEKGKDVCILLFFFTCEIHTFISLPSSQLAITFHAIAGRSLEDHEPHAAINESADVLLFAAGLL